MGALHTGRTTGPTGGLAREPVVIDERDRLRMQRRGPPVANRDLDALIVAGESVRGSGFGGLNRHAW